MFNDLSKVLDLIQTVLKDGSINYDYRGQEECRSFVLELSGKSEQEEEKEKYCFHLLHENKKTQLHQFVFLKNSCCFEFPEFQPSFVWKSSYVVLSLNVFNVFLLGNQMGMFGSSSIEGWLQMQLSNQVEYKLISMKNSKKKEKNTIEFKSFVKQQQFKDIWIGI